MNLMPALIVLPTAAAAAALALRRRPAACRPLAVAAFAAEAALAAVLFVRGAAPWGCGGAALLAADALSRLVCLGVGVFGLAAAVYALGWFSPPSRGDAAYWCMALLAEGTGIAAALADHLILLLAAWGLMGVSLYALASMGGPGAAGAAKKTMVMVGGSDAFLLLGAVLLVSRSGPSVHPPLPLPLAGKAAWTAYLCIAAAAFAKAGAVPLHTWVPDFAEAAPVPATALLPASVDKLLGVYLVARASLTIFAMDAAMQRFLLASGAVTVVLGVMMALAQHDMRRLLGYHAVSQVGYMLIGIGTGTAVGIAGGLFHLLNHCLYKSCLFFGAGAAARRAGGFDLDELGGLAGAMPATFAACLTAGLAISGVPPLNGFASKWMVYQGLLEMGRAGGGLWAVWLLAAMFGSVMTLASFVKLITAVFLARPSSPAALARPAVREASPALWGPAVAFAFACVVLGLFALPLGVAPLVAPAVGRPVAVPGLWSPTAATFLMLTGIAVGLAVCAAGRLFRAREAPVFVGGEAPGPRMTLPGTDFFRTVTEMGILRSFYRAALRGGFDVYERAGAAALALSAVLRRAHGGALPLYIGWCLAGFLAVCWALMR